MTSELITVDPDAVAANCLQLMTEHRIRHLPVIRDGELAGVVSIGDCVRCLLEGARDRADQLERFVGGGYVG
jgi:CBS domain-containing protein